MKAGKVFNLEDFEQNKIKFKQRSVEDSIDISFVLIDADLLLIWMNNSQHCFCFHVFVSLALHIFFAFLHQISAYAWS